MSITKGPIRTCAACGKRFQSDWTDEDSDKEIGKVVDGFLITGRPVPICTSCFEKAMASSGHHGCRRH